MKSHELARELGISQKELVNFLQQRRLTRNAAAPLAPGAIEAARSAFKPTSVAVKVEANGDRRVVLPPTLSVKDLAEKLGVSPVEVIKKLMASKILATINQVIDFATAEIVADEFGFTVEPVLSEDVVAIESAEGEGDVVTTSREELFSLANEDPAKLVVRPPIVTVLGHVAPGKTSILDAIRKTRVAAKEAGGITQRIGAYKIETADGHPVVFIDTPGHEALPPCARGAGRAPTSAVSWWRPMTASCRRRSRRSITHAPLRCRSSSPSTRWTRKGPTPIASIRSSPPTASSRATTARSEERR